MTILLTGRNGFIGKHLATALKRHHRLISLVRRKDEHIDYTNEEVIAADFNSLNTETLKYYPIDVIVHLGAALRGSSKEIHNSNIDGAKRIFDIANKLNVPVLFLSSTNALFYQQLGHYAASKYTGEEILKQSALSYVTVRVPLVLGKGTSFKQKVRDFYKQRKFFPLFGSSLGKTQPVPVEGLVKVLIQIIEKKIIGQQTLNIVGKNAYSYRHIIESMLEKEKTAFAQLPLKPSLGLVALMEKMRLSPPVSTEELKSINIDKLIDPKVHGTTMTLDNPTEILIHE